MDYRDDRDALRAHADDLEQRLGEASKRLDRAEADLAAARASLGAREAELRKVRGTASPSSSTRGLGALLCLVVLGLACALAALVVLRRKPSISPAPAPTPLAVAPSDRGNDRGGPGSGGVVPPGEHLQWGMGWEPSAFPVPIDDDATEDLVGSYKVLEGADQQLFMGGFDGATLRRVWVAGPFGTLREGITSTHVAVAGGRILVTDFRSRAHVLDVKTGKELSVVALTDRARRACAARGDAAAWIEIEDGKHVALDLEAFTLAPASRPASCTGDFADPACTFARAPCVVGGAGTTDVRAAITLGVGKDAVAVGTKHPGTPTLIAYAAGAGAGGPRWSVTVPPDPALAKPVPFDVPGADLAGGLLVVAYELVAGGFHLAAFDVQTGDRRWDVPIPRSAEGSGPRGITATEKRVYVAHWTWLDIFELETGKVIGTIGKW